MAKKYIGLDLSLTSTGVCIVDGKGDYKSSTRILPGNKRREMIRLEFIRENLVNLINGSTGLIAIENYAYGIQKSRSLTGLGELHGVVKHLLFSMGRDYILVTPNQLKKFITGDGRAKKDQMMLQTFKRYGIEFKNNDECDAFGLAKIAHEVSKGKIDKSLFDYQQKIITDLLKDEGLNEYRSHGSN